MKDIEKINWYRRRTLSHYSGMVEKGQLAVFPTAGVYSKAVFDRLQGFSRSYLVAYESMADDMDFKKVRRLVAGAEESSSYSKLVNLRKDHRAAQTILKGKRQIVMLSRFGQESLKIDLEAGRRAKSAEMEERLKRFMDLMDKEVKLEDVTYNSKLFFKTCSSFHLVTARDGV